MGLIGLAISSIFGGQDNQNRTGGCCRRRNMNQQPYLASSYPEITNYTGRSSCHQRKMERRYQRQLQRAERSQLRVEQRMERDFQRAERRQAGVMLVKQGAQRVKEWKNSNASAMLSSTISGSVVSAINTLRASRRRRVYILRV